MRRKPPLPTLPAVVAVLALLVAPARAGDGPTEPPKPAAPVVDAVGVDPAHVEAALVAAGANRGELERALARVHAAGDARKEAALRFLVANMPGKGYVVTAWKAKDGTAVAYDPLAFPSFHEAEVAFDALEKANGPIDFVKDRFVADVETLTADFLCRHVDNAFAAWASTPEGIRVAFPAFLEHVLPYRGSEEPVEDWLSPLLERFRTVPDEVAKAGTAQALLDWVGGEAAHRVRFDERYYLHPTDQGFAEMERSRLGRCEDITNMTTYCARARGLAVAADYTPAWGHRDNNHAWPVLLDAAGRGHEASNAHAAKVYRKVFSIQRDALKFRLPAGREPPNRFLASASQLDVTDQYAPTTDVAVDLDPAVAKDERQAYLCVFNGGEWVAITWAPVEAGRATFARMGRGSDGMLYLPAVHDGKALVPAGAPRVARKDGSVVVLAGTGADVALVATATTPEQVSVDTHAVTPVSHLRPQARYALARWTGAWTEVRVFAASEGPARFEALPGDGLFWLAEPDGKHLERPFTIEGGRQRFW